MKRIFSHLILKATILALLLAGCDTPSPSNKTDYPPNPKPVPTNTKQKPKPVPTATSQKTENDSNPISITDEIIGGGKTDEPNPNTVITIKNLTSADAICDLYIWPYGTDFTNQDLLGGGWLNPGQSIQLQELPSGDYSLWIRSCDGYELGRSANLSGPKTWKIYFFRK